MPLEMMTAPPLLEHQTAYMFFPLSGFRVDGTDIKTSWYMVGSGIHRTTLWVLTPLYVIWSQWQRHLPTLLERWRLNPSPHWADVQDVAEDLDSPSNFSF